MLSDKMPRIVGFVNCVLRDFPSLPWHQGSRQQCRYICGICTKLFTKSAVQGILSLSIASDLHVPSSGGVDASAACAEAGVALHKVDELEDGLGAEVDVAVEGEQERVHRPQPLLLLRQLPVVHDLVTAEKVPER